MWASPTGDQGHVPLSGVVLDTVRVSGSDHAVMSSGSATSSSDLSGGPAMRAMERSEGSARSALTCHSFVGLDQGDTGQAEQVCGVGEDPDDVGAALDFLAEPLEMA